MKISGKIIVFFFLLPATLSLKALPKNYLYISSGELASIHHLVARPDIEGVQIVYNWKNIELSKDKYDFSQIRADLNYLDSCHKKLFIQIQDRFFSPKAKNVPQYLLSDSLYKGGIVMQTDNPGEGKPQSSGWVAMQWNRNVQKRYQRMLGALAKEFDGKIEGINLPETAIDIDIKHDLSGFDCRKYFRAEIENMLYAKQVFKKSFVVQYANFWPCEWNNDHHFMSKLFETAQKNGVGVGGPDIVPWKKGQMKNSYPFFHLYKGKLPLVAMAIQEPTLTYTNPKTKQKFTKAEFIDFADHYLGTNIIFWTIHAPWLK